MRKSHTECLVLELESVQNCKQYEFVELAISTAVNYKIQSASDSPRGVSAATFVEASRRQSVRPLLAQQTLKTT